MRTPASRVSRTQPLRNPTCAERGAFTARRLKGTSVNVAHARSEATEKRKRTLLQEYRRVRARRAPAAAVAAGGCSLALLCSTAKPASSSTAASERQMRPRTPTRKRCSACSGCGRCSSAKPAGLRWQVRLDAALSEVLASRLPSDADDGDEEVLTHLGSSLADLDADDFVPSDGVSGPAPARPGKRVCADVLAPQEEDAELNDLITREYHFGGGLFTQKRTGEGEPPEGGGDDAAAPPRSKKEIMHEIIAKSKTAKRERMKEKEADDEQLDALDLTFKALAEVSSPGVCHVQQPSCLTRAVMRVRSLAR